jgi:hypothetical protein
MMKNPPNNYMSLCCSTRGIRRHIVSPLIAAGLALCHLSSVHAAEIKTIQPEDITQHQIETSIVPAKTIFIKVEDPVEAAGLMSDSHVAQAKQGWRVFDVTPYQYNEDFRGVFITYVRRF